MLGSSNGAALSSYGSVAYNAVPSLDSLEEGNDSNKCSRDNLSNEDIQRTVSTTSLLGKLTSGAIDLGPGVFIDELSIIANTINALLGVSLFAMPWGFQQAGMNNFKVHGDETLHNVN